jgi:hypothetical protein
MESIDGTSGKRMTKQSVATILDRELEATIREWLRRVNLVSELTDIPLSDEDRSLHLPKLFHDLTRRLRLGKGARLPSPQPPLHTAKPGEIKVTLPP